MHAAHGSTSQSDGMAHRNAATSLPALQNLIKRDPLGYEDEFVRRYRHFQSLLELHRQNPGSDSKDLVANVSFISHVAPCYAKLAAELPSALSSLLEEHSPLAFRQQKP